LLRSVIKLILDIRKIRKYYLINAFNEEEIKSEFNKEVGDFKADAHTTMINQTLELKSKMRYKFLDILHSISKIFVVTYSLKLEPYYSYSHPLFISFCGLMKATFSIIKEYFKASDFSKLLGIDHNHKTANRSSTLESLTSNKKLKYNISYFLLDNFPDLKILEEDDYFNDYYIDFNKVNLTHKGVGKPHMDHSMTSPTKKRRNGRNNTTLLLPNLNLYMPEINEKLLSN